MAAKHEWWLSVRARIDEDIRRDRLPTSADESSRKQMTVPGCLHVLRGLLDDDGLLISDVGSHKLWIARNFPVYVPNGCLISNGLASMGIALPGAIAASLQSPERQVVACMGDGGALMNIQELETAHRLELGFTMLVFRDDDYGLISWKQRQSRGRSVSTRIGNPDFVALAKAFGVAGHRAETPQQLAQLLQQSLTDRTLTLIEVPVDPSVSDALVARLTQ